MAAKKLSMEEVVDEVMNDVDTDRPIGKKSKNGNKVRYNEYLEKNINECLEVLSSLDLGNNLEAFKCCVAGFIKASTTVFHSPTDPAKILLNRSVCFGTIFESESRQWLRKIHIHLGGKVSIRRPYEGEIVRCLPVEMCRVVKTALEHSRHRL